jgi:2-polyprenyl-3-methyl-5-hydroxy-6-metoxy-1,4-benzoquinol methylase
MKVLRESDLDEFVRETDRRGGASTAQTLEYWEGFVYEPTFRVDTTLDPLSSEYLSQMLRFYTELSGRELNQTENELLEIDLEAHVAAPNSYNHGSPKILAGQYRLLTDALSNVPYGPNSKALDMGCGWGLSSEILANLGYQVTALDINPQFVELVNRRAVRLGLPIRAVLDTFEDFQPTEPVDLVLFYECLHHAVRPWVVLENLVKNLTSGGSLLLVGESIQSIWWPGWGLRLDPLALYVIRKYGWFESGWSQSFLYRLLAEQGLTARTLEDPLNVRGSIVIADRSKTLTAQQIGDFVDRTTWSCEPQFVVSSTRSILSVQGPENSDVVFEIFNFCPYAIEITVEQPGENIPVSLAPGRNELTFPSSQYSWTFVTEGWVPDEVVKNGDTRRIGFHIASIAFQPRSTDR